MDQPIRPQDTIKKPFVKKEKEEKKELKKGDTCPECGQIIK
jgi:hypothetical protein